MLQPNQVSAVFKFDNGYGASVTRHRDLTGKYQEDEYELAVVKFYESGGYDFVYDTPITSDVLPYRSGEEIADLFKEIEAL